MTAETEPEQRTGPDAGSTGAGNEKGTKRLQILGYLPRNEVTDSTDDGISTNDEGSSTNARGGSSHVIYVAFGFDRQDIPG